MTADLPLPTLVRRQMTKLGLSYRAAALAAGRVPSSATIHQIATGRTPYLTDPLIAAGLARALQVPAERLMKVGAPPADPSPRPFVLPSRSGYLTRRERRILTEMMTVLLDNRGAPGD